MSRIINIEEANTEIEKLLKKNQKLSFFCGAGISRLFPAFAPLFNELRDGIIDALISSLETKNEINLKDFHLIKKEIKSFETLNDIWIKPEVAFQWFSARLGDDFYDAFTILNEGKPNNNHKILAKLISRNYPIAIATTNFDLYLEKALKDYKIETKIYGSNFSVGKILPFIKYIDIDLDTQSNSVPILKIHGSLDEPKTIKATLNQVKPIIKDESAKALSKILRNRHLIIIGYSGNDYDIFPFLKRNYRYAKSVYWFVLSKESMKSELNFFTKDFTIVEGDLNLFFNKLHKSIFRNPFRPSSSRNRTPNIIKNCDPLLHTWALKFNPIEVCYSLALFGLHVGMNNLVTNMCYILINSKKSTLLYQTRSLNILANFYRKIELSKALDYIKLAEKQGYLLRTEDPKLYSNILGTAGTIFFQTGEYKTAIKYLKKSNIWARKTKQFSLLAANYDDIGNILRNSKIPIKALYYHKKSLKIRTEINDLTGITLCLNNIGLTYQEMGKYQKAEKFLLQSIDLKRAEISHLPSLINGLLNLSELYLLLNKSSKSIKLLRKSLKYAKSENNRIAETRCYFNIAEYYRINNNSDKAQEFFKLAERYAKTIPYWSTDSYRMKWINKIKQKFL